MCMINNDQQEKQSDLDSLWDQWKQAWQDLQGRDFNKQKSQSLFIKWFQKAYTEADKERESNKTQNFMYKRQFLVLLRIAIIVQIILAVSILVPCTFDYLSKRMVYIEVFLLSILVLFAIIIAKKWTFINTRKHGPDTLVFNIYGSRRCFASCSIWIHIEGVVRKKQTTS